MEGKGRAYDGGRAGGSEHMVHINKYTYIETSSRDSHMQRDQKNIPHY